jgi:hypothetical protein
MYPTSAAEDGKDLQESHELKNHGFLAAINSRIFTGKDLGGNGNLQGSSSANRLDLEFIRPFIGENPWSRG